jgi:hypothetical protein
VIGIFDRGFDSSYAADAKDTFIVDLDIMISLKIISDPAISFVRVFSVDFLDFLCDPFIFTDPFAEIPLEPFVVGRSGYMKDLTT